MLTLIILFIFGRQIGLDELQQVKPNVWEAQGILGFAPTQVEALKYMQALYDYQKKLIPEKSLSSLDTKDGFGKHWSNQDPTGGFFHHEGLLSFVVAKNQESLKQNYSTALQKFKTDYREFVSKSLPENKPSAPSVSISSVLIQPIVFAGKKQAFFGTSGIKPSGLHAMSTEARFPQIMVLGSHDVPVRSPSEMFSITAELKPNHFFVVMVPDDLEDPVLRPQYMQVPTDTPEQGDASGTTEVTVDYLDGRPEERLIIRWTVQPPKSSKLLPGNDSWDEILASLGTPNAQVEPNRKQDLDGQIRPCVHENSYGAKSYSLLAKAKGKSFYYWVPTVTQLLLLKEFATEKKLFSFGELCDRIMQMKELNNKIGYQIEKIKDGTFKW